MDDKLKKWLSETQQEIESLKHKKQVPAKSGITFLLNVYQRKMEDDDFVIGMEQLIESCVNDQDTHDFAVFALLGLSLFDRDTWDEYKEFFK